MKNLKKLTALCTAAAMLALTACSSPAPAPAATTAAAPAATTAAPATQAATTAATTAAPATEAAKQDIAWPDHTVQIVMPYKPGGDSDTYARLCAERMEKILGVPVVIVNQNGANNTLAPQTVLDADADGYNVLYFNSSMMTQEALGVFEDLGFSILEDFVPCCSIGIDDTYCIVAKTEKGWKDWSDVVKVLKDAPESVTFSMMFNGNTQYLELAMEEASGVQLKGIDVGSGTADRIVALLGDQVDIVCCNVSSVVDYIEKGELVNLGFYSLERNPYFPDVPALGELGCPVRNPKYYSLYFKKGTDPAIVEKFAAAAKEACEDPSYKEALEKYYAQNIFTDAEGTQKWNKEYAASQKELLSALQK